MDSKRPNSPSGINKFINTGGKISPPQAERVTLVRKNFGQVGMDNTNVRKIHDILAGIPDTADLVTDPDSSDSISAIMEAMDKLSLEDIGLNRQRVEGVDCSQCFEVFSSENFQLAVFILPAGEKLHLHDHPNMAVLSKILIGKMEVKSYDSMTVDFPTADIPVSAPTLAVKEFPTPPWSLSAVHNNFHEFVAVSPTVVFEALLPPYGDEERVCNYYEPYESPLVPDGFLLRIIDPPDDGPIGIEI